MGMYTNKIPWHQVHPPDSMPGIEYPPDFPLSISRRMTRSAAWRVCFVAIETYNSKFKLEKTVDIWNAKPPNNIQSARFLYHRKRPCPSMPPPRSWSQRTLVLFPCPKRQISPGPWEVAQGDPMKSWRSPGDIKHKLYTKVAQSPGYKNSRQTVWGMVGLSWFEDLIWILEEHFIPLRSG